MTDFTREAQHQLRDTSHFHWSAVALLAFVFYVYAVYCRNDQVMSETTAWTAASAPDDPRIGQLFRELFQVGFSDSPMLRPQLSNDRM